MLVDLLSHLETLVSPVAGLGCISGDASTMALVILGVLVVWLAALVWVQVR